MIGPVGVGKSRLLEELASRHLDEGAEVISITGAEADSDVPLGPLMGIVDPSPRANLPQLVVTELADRARNRRVVLIVDDAHLMDQASSAVLHNVARSKIVWLAMGVNSGETDESGIHSLWVDGYIERIDVEPLDRRTTAALIEAVIGPVSSTTEAWLWELCQGRPLYLREVLAWAEDANALSRVDGVVTIETSESVPTRLRELIGLHLRRLGKDTVNDLAAIEFSQPIAANLVRRFVDGGNLNELIERGLVTWTNEELRVAHPLYGEIAVGNLSTEDRDELRVDIATHLADEPGHEIQAARLMLGTGRDPPPDLLEKAVESALLQRRGRLSERLASVLVELRGEPDDLVDLASAKALLGDLEQADVLYERALDDSPAEKRSAVWLRRIRDWFECSTDQIRARDLAARALATVEGPDRESIEAMWLRCRMFLEPLAPVYDDLIDLAGRVEADHPTVSLDIITSGWHLLRVESSLEWSNRAIAATREEPLEHARARQVAICVTGWGVSLRTAGSMADDFVRWAEESMHPDNIVLARCASVIVSARSGIASDTRDAIQCLSVSQERSPHLQHLPLILGERALAESALVGQEKETRRTLESIASLPSGAAVNSRVLASIASARLAHRSGDEDQARKLLNTGIRHAVWRNSAAHELLCRREHLYTFGPDSENVDRITEIGEEAKVGLAAIYAREARAALARDATAMDAVTQDAWQFGAAGLAWESAAMAHRFHRERGDLCSAWKAELRWNQIGRQFTNQHSPAHSFVEAVLTEREKQVVEAVAAGMTNREAGETLFISPKTVKRHLERIYDTLGIHSREELADILHEGQVPPLHV